MKKQKWMMMGASAVICSALLVPAAFAKDKDESGATPPVFFAPGQANVQIVDPAVTPTGAAFLFPAEDPNQKDK